MAEDPENASKVIDAHQEMVARVEQGTSRVRALSVITIIVAGVLSVAYLSQLALPLTGVKTVTVNLTDPANVVTELVVLALALAWLYVGISDLRFSWRIRGEIESARRREKELQERVS
jgi:hypothetical protein